jgi:hypothetical protein
VGNSIFNNVQMTITYKKIALYYLLLSFSFGIISGILNGLSIVLIFDIMLVALVFAIFFTKKIHKDSMQIIILIIFAMICMFGVFRYGFNPTTLGLFFKSRGFFVFLATTFFYLFTFSKLDTDELVKVDILVENVIKLNIIAILVEGIAINYFGMQSYLYQIFSSADYRINPVPVFFDSIPNGLVFGRQNASVISVIGILLWLPWNKGRRRVLRNNIWLFASGVSWMLTMTTTSIVCFIVPVLFIYFTGMVKERRLFFLIFSAMLVYAVISYYQNILEMRYGDSILSYENTDDFIESYYYAFTEPIEQIKIAPLEIIIGTGHLIEEDTKYSKIMSRTESLELGVLAMAIKHGAILTGITLVFFLIHILKLLRFFHESIVSKVEKGIILRSFCITLPLIVSLGHYNSLFKPGIMQLMATAVALPYVLRKKKEEMMSMRE